MKGCLRERCLNLYKITLTKEDRRRSSFPILCYIALLKLNLSNNGVHANVYDYAKLEKKQAQQIAVTGDSLR